MDFDKCLGELNQFLVGDAQAIMKAVNNSSSTAISNNFVLELNAFDKVIVFDNDPIKGTVSNKDLACKSGIYIFKMIKNYVRGKMFNDVNYGAPLNNHSITSFGVGDILYIGTAKSILKRMHQHFAVDSNYNRTGSLKLGSTNRSGILNHFLIYAFCIKNEYRKYYQIIGSAVEKSLHCNMAVLVGNK